MLTRCVLQLVPQHCRRRRPHRGGGHQSSTGQPGQILSSLGYRSKWAETSIYIYECMLVCLCTGILIIVQLYL